METSVYALLWLSFALSIASVSAVAAEHGKSPSQQPDPLTRAAEEFKVLTRDWGMRPGSPQLRKSILAGKCSGTAVSTKTSETTLSMPSPTK
jgi:hypothetical protein